MSTMYPRRQGKNGQKVWYGNFFVNGRQIRERLHTDYETAKQLFKEREHELLFGKPEKPPVSVEDAKAQFLASLAPKQLSDGRLRVIKHALRRFSELCATYHLEYLQQVSGATAQSYVLERQTDTAKRKYMNKQDEEDYKYQHEPTITPWTVNNDINTLRRFFRYCIRMDLCDHNPFLKVEKLKERKKPEPYRFSDKDLKKLWKVAGKFTDFYATMLYTGLRPTDTLTLTVQEIAGGRLNLRMNKTGTWLKNVPVPEKLMEQLKPRIAEQDEYLFPEVQTDRQQRNARKRIQQLFSVQQVRERRINLHTFRHTYAHRLLQSGVPKEKVQTLLGHESITTTETYAQWVENGQLKETVSGLKFGV